VTALTGRNLGPLGAGPRAVRSIIATWDGFRRDHFVRHRRVSGVGRPRQTSRRADKAVKGSLSFSGFTPGDGRRRSKLLIVFKSELESKGETRDRI
jgi:hypothetical protein